MAPSAPLNSPESLAETLRLMKNEARTLKDRARSYPNGQEFKILLLLKAAAILQDCLKFIVEHRRHLGREEALCRDQRDSLLEYVRKEVEQSNTNYDQYKAEPVKPTKLQKKCKTGEQGEKLVPSPH
ncbi:hypothetical protein NHJ13051_005199 [Beauveria bassiana]|uniref:Uncharacterized protein n=1 Tax=Beauveria bassiana TaxID=176275 RepID=A0A2N6NCX2_BEABA|nr:hypothetical protein BM221_009267 [Beauveria bassiana]